MLREDFEKLPYASRAQLLTLRSYLADILEQNRDAIYLIEPGANIHAYAAYDVNFYFRIVKVTPTAKNVNLYEVVKRPLSAVDNSAEKSFERTSEGSGSRRTFQCGSLLSWRTLNTPSCPELNGDKSTLLSAQLIR